MIAHGVVGKRNFNAGATVEGIGRHKVQERAEVVEQRQDGNRERKKRYITVIAVVDTFSAVNPCSQRWTGCRRV